MIDVSEKNINQVLQNYVKELQEDVKVNEYNLKEKALTTSAMWAKWLSYLYNEKTNLEKIADTKQKILKKKMADNKNNDSVLRMKSQDKIEQNDENIKKLNIYAKMTQNNIDFIERALNIFANFGFQIKNIQEIIKLNLSH